MHFRIRSLLAASLVVAALAACSSDKATGPDPALIGTWNATSFMALGQDLIQQGGMTLEATLTNANTYTLDVTGDLTGNCDPGPDCVVTGNYSATAAQITFDPGTVDAVTFNYSIAGSTMTLTGNIGGIPATITLQKVP